MRILECFKKSKTSVFTDFIVYFMLTSNFALAFVFEILNLSLQFFSKNNPK